MYKKGAGIMNDRINRVEFWRRIIERKHNVDYSITECIDGRLLINEEILDKVIEDNMLDFLDLDEKEREAINQGFRPDRYYSAFENMIRAQKAS